MLSARFSDLGCQFCVYRVLKKAETGSDYSSCGIVEYGRADLSLAQAFTPGLVKRPEFLSPIIWGFR